jgi:hypothetical protein
MTPPAFPTGYSWFRSVIMSRSQVLAVPCQVLFCPVLSCAIGNGADGLIRPGQVSTAEMMLRFIDLVTGLNEDRRE